MKNDNQGQKSNQQTKKNPGEQKIQPGQRNPNQKNNFGSQKMEGKNSMSGEQQNMKGASHQHYGYEEDDKGSNSRR